jgi:hypothetical protein
MSLVKKLLCGAALLSLMLSTQSFAIIGIGVHYGMDFSLGMKNSEGNGDKVRFDSLSLDLGGTNVLVGKDIPAFVSRKDFKSDFSFGGKIFIDIIPVLDVVEISANFGLWEYKGSINYPSALRVSAVQAVTAPSDTNFSYTNMPVTLDQVGLSYLGLKNTPYAKLNLDASIHKYLLQIPPVVKMLKIYAGGGLTCNFATPMLSSNLVQDAINESANGQLDMTTIGPSLLSNNAVMKKVVEKIIVGLTEPSYGAHIDAGVNFKIPIVPIAFYIDGRFMIPFGKLDKYVDIGGMGLLVNGGVALNF